MDKSREEILSLLLTKSALKQDIYEDTKEVFSNFKRIMLQEVDFFKPLINDERVRMQFIDKGDYESQVFIGSDVLVFHMHTNVFLLPEQHEFWKLDYLKNNPDKGYFGIIYIYNFLAQSFIQGRMNDPGYLIGRIFVNKDGHFFVEGKGPLGTEFTDLEHGVLDDQVLCRIAHTSFAYALDFDLLTPPYEIVAQINVMQIQAISSSLNLQTGKRLGFKFEAGENNIF
jgi:hypothetical protein